MKNQDSQERECIHCGQTQSRVDLGKGGGCNFEGPMLHCRQCDILSFLPSFTYLDSDNRILESHPEIDAVKNSEPGSVNLVNEKDWVVIFPTSTESLKQIVNVQIGGQRLTRDLEMFLANILGFSAMHCTFGEPLYIDITFGGYGTDPRGLWDVPEVKAWVWGVWYRTPDMAVFLTPSSLKTLLLILIAAMPDDYFSEQSKALAGSFGNHIKGDVLKASILCVHSTGALEHRIAGLASSDSRFNKMRSLVSDFGPRFRQVMETLSHR